MTNQAQSLGPGAPSRSPNGARSASASLPFDEAFCADDEFGSGPKSTAECLTMLRAALAWLDEIDPDLPRSHDATLSLSGGYVQQAIELIQATEDRGR